MLKTNESSNTKRIVRTGDRYPAQGFQKVVQTFTAVGGETSVTLTQFSYKPGLRQISVKRSSCAGELNLGAQDYTETSSTVVSFPSSEPLLAGEIVEVAQDYVITGILAVAPRPDCYTATATTGQTLISCSLLSPIFSTLTFVYKGLPA